jgi:hypothetical protein
MRGCTNTQDLGMKYLYLRRFLRSLIGVRANTVAEPKANVAGPNQNGAISEQGFCNWKTEWRALAAFGKILPRAMRSSAARSVTLPMPPATWSSSSITPYCAQRKVPSRLLCRLSNLSYKPNRDAEAGTDVVPRPRDYVCKERTQRTHRKFGHEIRTVSL